MDIPEIKFCAKKKKPLIMDNTKYFSVYDFSLTEEEINKVHKELSETDEKKIRCIRELKGKLANHQDVKYRTDAKYLLRYLRARKFDCSKAYQNIKEAYSFKRKRPEVLQIPWNLESLLNRNFFFYLPYTDENGNILVYTDLGKWNHQEVSLTELMQAINITWDILSMNPRCQINGVIAIWDVKELNKYHVASLLGNIGIRTLSYYLQRYYPLRVNSVLFINSGRLTRLMYRMIRPFLTQKIFERIVLLGSDLKELHQYVNPALLPKMIGGALEEDQHNITQSILDNIDYIKYERTFI